MNELQRTFDGQLIPVAQHRLDSVWCEDVNEYRLREDTYMLGQLVGLMADGGILCQHCMEKESKLVVRHSELSKQWLHVGNMVSDYNHGERCSHCGSATLNYYATGEGEGYAIAVEEMNEQIRENNAEEFKTFFRNIEEWVEEYTESDDYMSEYLQLIHEGDKLRQVIFKVLHDFNTEHELKRAMNLRLRTYVASWSDAFINDMVKYILDYNLIFYCSTDEYSSTTGDVYVDSFPVGEHEEQIELSSVREDIGQYLIHEDTGNCLSDERILDILEAYNERQRDFTLRIHRTKSLKYFTFYMYVYTGMRVDFYMEWEQFVQALAECTVRWCRDVDYRRNGI